MTGGKFHPRRGGTWQQQRTIVPKENRTSPDGIVHRTAAEMRRWNQLRLLERAGHIRNLRREVKYKLEMPFPHRLVTAATTLTDICDPIVSVKSRKGNVRTYTADFVYETSLNDEPVRVHGFRLADGWHEIIEDIKGFLEPAQELRMDVFEAFYKKRIFINKV